VALDENKYSKKEAGATLIPARQNPMPSLNNTNKKENSESEKSSSESGQESRTEENTESEEKSEELEESSNKEEQNTSSTTEAVAKAVVIKKKLTRVMMIINAIPYILFGVLIVFTVMLFVALISTLVDEIPFLSDILGAGPEEQLVDNYEYSIVDSFGSIYGNSSCAILEEYVPFTHEYIVSKSSNDNIYSVVDGEIIYVNNKGTNLYSAYDYKTGKCLCNGKLCNNYNGSEIKIKFKSDDIEYIVIYSNLATINVAVGDFVSKGDLIGTEGNTGCVSSKRLTFKVVSENGISYNTNDLLSTCTNSNTLYDACNFRNVTINILDENNNFIKTVAFYDYIKANIYQDFKEQISNKEFLKVASIIETTKFLRENNYKIGDNSLNVKVNSYQDVIVPENESELIDSAISDTFNQVLTYGNNFALANYSTSCTRNETNKNTNSIYNELCVSEAIKMDKTYEEIIRIYYPNYSLNKNYCLNYSNQVNMYKINNSKPYLNSEFFDEQVIKYNTMLETRINIAQYGTRAGVVEAARFLSLGLDKKVPFANGGKYFEKGINKYWAAEGLDSSGFISWALLNGGAKINEDRNILGIISNNTAGNLKIDSSFYDNYDKVQVGDFAYKDSKIGIIIGKSGNTLYVAESDIENGIVVTEIKSFGKSDSDYTHIYFADDYYSELGNLTNMW